MSKKIACISVFILLLSTVQSYGQLSFDGWTQTYLGIYSYDGAVRENAFTLRLQYSGTNLYEPNWKMSVQVISPFVSGNKMFPVNRVKLIPARTEGQYNFPGPLPGIEDIGVISPTTLSDNSEVFIVPSSNAPLFHKSQYTNYSSLHLLFNMVVDGGSYLQKLSNQSFRGIVRFTAYRQDNSIIGIKDFSFEIQVHSLSGTPPLDNYSISFSTEATNAKIEHVTLNDYLDGKSVTYRDGLTVWAETDFQLTVRSVEPHFSSISGNTLPLNIISLQLSGKTGATTPVVLSNSSKVILNGKSTNSAPEKYDIIYFTGANDERLYDVSSDQYSTQLMFEIIPR